MTRLTAVVLMTAAALATPITTQVAQTQAEFLPPQVRILIKIAKGVCHLYSKRADWKDNMEKPKKVHARARAHKAWPAKKRRAVRRAAEAPAPSSPAAAPAPTAASASAAQAPPAAASAGARRGRPAAASARRRLSRVSRRARAALRRGAAAARRRLSRVSRRARAALRRGAAPTKAATPAAAPTKAATPAAAPTKAAVVQKAAPAGALKKAAPPAVKPVQAKAVVAAPKNQDGTKAAAAAARRRKAAATNRLAQTSSSSSVQKLNAYQVKVLKKVFKRFLPKVQKKVKNVKTVKKYLNDIKAGKKPSLDETVGAACAVVHVI